MKPAQQATNNSLKVTVGKRILVLGGNGFIGHHIVKQLATSKPIIGTRGLHKPRDSRQRQVPLHRMLAASDWQQTLADIDIVVNAVGILRERRGESYEAVHHLAVKALASACKTQQIKLIHISALGLENPVTAPFSVSKKHGEQALINSEADWHIIRASLVEGEGAYGGSWFQRIAKWPLHFVPQKHAYIAPVRVERIAETVQQIIDNDTAACEAQERIHEISNGVKYLLPDYLAALNDGKAKPRIVVPDVLVRACTRVCDWLKLTPLTAGHHELLSFDNCPVDTELPIYSPDVEPQQVLKGRTASQSEASINPSS